MMTTARFFHEKVLKAFHFCCLKPFSNKVSPREK